MPMLLYYQVMRRTYMYIWCLWAYAKIKFSMKKLLALNNLSDIFHTELYLAYYNTYFLLCPSIYTGVHCRHTSNLFILPQQIHRCLVKVYLLPLGFTPYIVYVYILPLKFYSAPVDTQMLNVSTGTNLTFTFYFSRYKGVQ